MGSFLDKRIEILRKQCTAKIRYPSEELAVKAIGKASSKRNVALRIYCCGVCLGFHLTKLRAVVTGKLKKPGMCAHPKCSNQHKKESEFCSAHEEKKPPKPQPVSPKNKCHADGCERRRWKRTAFCGDHIHLSFKANNVDARADLIKAGVLIPFEAKK